MGDEATLSYCSYYIKKIANSDNIRNNLTHVYQFCQARDYEKLVYDFYLLHWAWDDIDYGNDYTPYWESAKKDNIEKIVVDTAIKWAEENEQHYTQHELCKKPNKFCFFLRFCRAIIWLVQAVVFYYCKNLF